MFSYAEFQSYWSYFESNVLIIYMDLNLILNPIQTLIEANSNPTTTPILSRIELKSLFMAGREFSGGDINQILRGSKSIPRVLPEERDIVKSLFKLRLKIPSKIPALATKFPKIHDTENWIVGESIHYQKRLYDPKRSGEEMQFNPEYRKRVCANIVYYVSGIPVENRLNCGKIGKYLAVSTSQKFKIPFIVVYDTTMSLWKIIFITMLGEDMKPNTIDPFMAVEKTIQTGIDKKKRIL